MQILSNFQKNTKNTPKWIWNFSELTSDFKNGGTPYTHDERETQKPVGQDQRLYKIKKPAKPCVATVALNQNMNNQPARNFLTY